MGSPPSKLPPLRTGDAVITPDGCEGRITEVLPSGKAFVRYRYGSGYELFDPLYLARAAGGSGGFSVGDDAVTAEGFLVKVGGVLRSGELAVRFPEAATYFIRDPRDLRHTDWQSLDRRMAIERLRERLAHQAETIGKAADKNRQTAEERFKL